METSIDRAAANYTLEYRGFTIRVKRDFGDSFHLIDGMPCAWGYIVTRGACNVMPGATWFQTVKDAKRAVDVFLQTQDDGEFWRVLRDPEAAA